MVCMVAIIAVIVSCEHNTKTSDFKSEHADSLIFEAGLQKDYNCVFALADSFDEKWADNRMKELTEIATVYQQKGGNLGY